MIFAIYFAVLSSTVADATSTVLDQDPTPLLYLTGSMLFLVGSVSLVLATMPLRGGNWSPVIHDAAPFWGCTSFLIVSIMFVADAFRVVSGEVYEQWLGI